MPKEISRSTTKNGKGRKAAPLWWKRLSLNEQVDYLDEHPRSKLKPNIKKPKQLPPEIEQTVDEKAPEIIDDLTSAVDKAEKRWPDIVKNMTPDEVKSLSEQILKASNDNNGKKRKPDEDAEIGGFFDDLHNGSGRRTAVAIALAAKLGLLAVGAGALMAVDPSYVFLLPQIGMGLWRAIPDGTFSNGLVLYMGHRMLTGMRKGLDDVRKDTKKLKESIVDAEPTTIASSAKAQETSNYSHYTDIIKALSVVESEKVQLTVQHLDSQTHPLNRLAASIYLLYRVENVLPRLHNIYMTCTSQGHMQLKPRLQKNILEYKSIRQRLKEDIRTLSTMINPEGMEGFGDKIFTAIKSAFPKLTISRHRTAIFNSLENNSLQVVHCYEFGTTTGKRRGNVTLYVHANKLSYVLERSSDYTPAVLHAGTFGDLQTQLKQHIKEVFA